MEKEEIQNNIINFGDQLNPLSRDVQRIAHEVSREYDNQKQIKDEINDIVDRMGILASEMGVDIDTTKTEELVFSEINIEVDSCYKIAKNKIKKFPKLSSTEMFYSVIVGVLSVAIDLVFVGTPDVVKLRDGTEKFDGGIFTSVLRKVGNDPNQKSYAVFHWLSENCKVPYDLSAVKGVVNPNNHRIRSLGHDPLFGLFFAVADIILGTTTCIDNAGHLQILIGKNQASMQEKFLSVFFYIGHILSDLCTARGIPVPGFFLTQFFVGDGGSDSLAKKAEMMYYNGYDMRNLASSSIPVIVKNLLIDAYCLLESEESSIGLGIAETEIAKMQKELKREKMEFVSDCVAVGGNLGKIFLPPNCGNFAALNYIQWGQFIKSSLAMASVAMRDTTVEEIVDTRRKIDDKWNSLKNE